MQVDTQAVGASKKMIWTGRILSVLPVLLMLFGAVFSLVKPAAVQEGFKKYGYPEQAFRGIIVTELACVVLYVIPRTAVLGAILLTGYLGGATATHVRVGDPLFSHVLFPVYMGLLVWCCVYF